MTEYLPTVADPQTMLANLRAARTDVGSGAGGGETYLRVDKHSGVLTYGADSAPLPATMRFVIGLHDIYHGYLVTTSDNQVTERRMVPMALNSVRPTPPGDYGTFEKGGARNATEIGLSSIDEPGFRLTFTAWGPSSANRIGTLLQQSIRHAEETVEGQAGFIHPIVIVQSGSYKHKTYGTIHHIDFEVVDWLHRDGKTLLSKRSTPAEPDGPPPWEDGDDDDMSEAERETLLKA